MTYLGRPIFTLPHDWAAAPGASMDYALQSLELGQLPPAYWSAAEAVVRAWDLRLTCPSAAHYDQLLAFFDVLQGPFTGFWLPTPELACTILDAGPGELTIAGQRMADWWADEARRHLWLVPPSGAPVAAEITEVAPNPDGTETLTLHPTVTPGTDWQAYWLSYVRLAGAIETEWAAEGIARCRLRLVELPAEYAQVETGRAPVWCYTLRDEAGTSWRYTSWVENVPDPAQPQIVFAAAQISHGTEHRAGLEDSRDTELTMDASLPPAAALQAGRTVSVEVARMYPGQGLQVQWRGLLDRPTWSGRRLSARLTAWPWAADTRLPRRPVSERCPWRVFSTPCGLDPTPHRVAVTIGSINGRAIVCSGSFPAVGAHHYALGTLTIEGLAWDILDSAAPANGQITLTLARRPTFGAGSTGWLLPGCDGRAATCTAFGNLANFGGVPRATRNLSLGVTPPPNLSGGKK